MSEDRETTRLLDEYADGRLSEADAEKLLVALEASEPLRKRLALVSIVERLLSAARLAPVTGDRVMGALREGGHLPARRPSPRTMRVKKPRGAGSPVTGLGMRGTTGETHRSTFGAVVAVLILSALLGGGVWWWVAGKKPTTSRFPLVPSGSALPDVSGIAAASPAVVPVPGPKTAIPVETTESLVTNTAPAEGVSSADLPESAFQDDTPQPAGDGSDDPGFVPPPGKGPRVPEVATSVKDRPAGALVPMAGTSPRSRPKTSLLFVKLDIGKPRLWNAVPGDVASLVAEIKARTGLAYTQVTRTIDEVDADPEKNPVLVLSGHYRFAFTPAQRATLRKFMMAGGMMVFDSGLGSKPFYDSARHELGLIFRDAPLQRMGTDHPIFRTYYEVRHVRYGDGVVSQTHNRDDDAPWLEGVTVRCRTVAILSRWGLAAGWDRREEDRWPAYKAEEAIQIGVNLASYAIAVRGWARQSAPMSVADVAGKAGDKMFVGQVIYDGEWKTRPGALPMLLRTFNRRTSVPVKLGVREIRLSDPAIFNLPVLYMTGHEGFKFRDEEVAMLRKYLASGGFLFAEACCGRRGFDRSFREQMGRVLPGQAIAPMPSGSDVYSVPNPVRRISVTPSLAGVLGKTVIAPQLEGVLFGGHYVVIYSPYGMAGSWETSQNPYALGYNDVEALKLGQNILMYAVTN